MDRLLLQQLTTQDLDVYLREIEQAIEMHIHWLARVYRSLVCHTPPVEQDLAEHPDRICNFGRWYHSIENEELRNSPAFIAIDAVHRNVHETARVLLQKSQRGEAITPEDYDQLVAASNTMREQSISLRNLLKRDQALISRLMLKVFENASEGVIITDPKTHILNINDAFTQVTGYSADEVIGQRPSLLYSGRQDDDFYHRMWQQLTETGHWEGEIWNRRKNGDIYLEWLSIAAVNDEDGNVTHYVGIFSDITQAKENEHQLRYLAHYDQLTRLPNRTLFQDRLRQALAMARRDGLQVAVLFLDLDGFKEVNDALGHGAGDELLRQVALRLQGTLRESDTVSRFGGDEFTIVLSDVRGRDAVARIAGKLVESVARPYDLGGETAHVTTSLGISLYPDMTRSSEELIHQADSAMYHAKNHGKNHYEFYDPLNNE
jgi:diguanylate cyclase (GGDEF)-like protein/PAS domain S-box-containing protein